MLLCQQPEHENPWDEPAREGLWERTVRERKARALCRQCPVLDACEQYLQECEAARTPVGGIVAGRKYQARKPSCVCGEPRKLRDSEMCSPCYAQRHSHHGNEIVCSECGQAQVHHARGMCKPCYFRWRKRYVKIVCGKCGQERAHEGRGMCGTCYNRWYRSQRG